MTRSRKKRIHLAKETRARARQALGLPPAERIVPDKRLKPPKHKKKLIEDDSV